MAITFKKNGKEENTETHHSTRAQEERRVE
jgi:hypothetical protein